MSKLSGVFWWRGGKRKESLQLRLWNLNICIEKVHAKCWLAEMTLIVTSLPLAGVSQCLFAFTLISTSSWLAEIWQLSQWGAIGELEGEFKFQSRSRKLSFLFPPRRTCLQAKAYVESPWSHFSGKKCSWRIFTHILFEELQIPFPPSSIIWQQHGTNLTWQFFLVCVIGISYPLLQTLDPPV